MEPAVLGCGEFKLFVESKILSVVWDVLTTYGTEHLVVLDYMWPIFCFWASRGRVDLAVLEVMWVPNTHTVLSAWRGQSGCSWWSRSCRWPEGGVVIGRWGEGGGGLHAGLWNKRSCWLLGGRNCGSGHVWDGLRKDDRVATSPIEKRTVLYTVYSALPQEKDVLLVTKLR